MHHFSFLFILTATSCYVRLLKAKELKFKTTEEDFASSANDGPKQEVTLDNDRRKVFNVFKNILECNKNKKPTSEGGKELELFQGDIAMTKRMRKALKLSGPDDKPKKNKGKGDKAKSGKGSDKGSDKRDTRAATGSDSSTWPTINGKVHVPFVIEDSSVANTGVIQSAMAHWMMSVPCIKFIQQTSELDYISFFSGAGCYSQVGRIGGKQRISVGPGCESMGIIAHEIGHAVGFWHEQARPDRDNFVTIVWDNIEPGKETEFYKIEGDAINSRGVEYDIGSLMHFGPDAFPRTQGLITIVTKDGSTNFGQRDGLSPSDIEQAKRIYCGDCSYQDSSEFCPTWKAAGYCEQGSVFHDVMLQICQRTCLCNVCEDNNISCEEWSRTGYCTNNSYLEYMTTYCRKSCGHCN